MIKIIDKDLEDYASRYSGAEDQLLQNIAKETHTNVSSAQMLSGHLSGSFLAMIASIHKPDLILEIGTYVGYSALCLAKYLTPHGRLVTLDNDPEYIKIAQENISKSPLSQKIELRFGPALESIKQIEEPIDLVFIDADKGNYPLYYETVLPKLRQGGLILIDNCLWSGRVLNPTSDDDFAIHELNEKISRDDRVQSVITTIRDGIHIVRKR